MVIYGTIYCVDNGTIRARERSARELHRVNRSDEKDDAADAINALATSINVS